MKANPRKDASILSTLSLTALCAAMLVSGCVPPPRAPAPIPRPTPAPAPTPAPLPAPRDWRDAPATPGDWQWSSSPGRSTASFAGGQFVMRCDLAQHTVTLLRALPGASAQTPQTPMSITTTDTTRALIAVPADTGVAVTLSARDPLLDAMAFSRGRFAVEAAGSAALYVPSWTEVSRVIEDCR